MPKQTDTHRPAIMLVSSVLALAFAGRGDYALATTRPIARTTHALIANDEGHLHIVGESGADIIEEGRVTGTLPGRVWVSFDLETAVTARFVLYPNGGGSISGHATGKLHSASRYSSFGGAMWITKGTGRFRHARGEGGLYGTILREGSFPAVVQTRGTLHY